jgi:hypothetical protein
MRFVLIFLLATSAFAQVDVPYTDAIRANTTGPSVPAGASSKPYLRKFLTSSPIHRTGFPRPYVVRGAKRLPDSRPRQPAPRHLRRWFRRGGADEMDDGLVIEREFEHDVDDAQ